MDTFSVPQREVHARVHLEDGKGTEGVMYVPLEGPDGGPSRLIDRLNEPEEFIALGQDQKGTGGQQTQLLNKSRILTVVVQDDDVEKEATQQLREAARRHHLLVRVRLTSGDEYLGHLFYVQSPDQARFGDFLNTQRRFIPVLANEQLVYVNRGHIVTAVALRGE